MSTTDTAIQEAMTEAVARVPAALREIRGFYRLTNGQIAELVDKDRNWCPGRAGVHWGCHRRPGHRHQCLRH